MPPPGSPGPFALSDAREFRDLFSDAGFGDLAVDRVSTPLRAPSFSAWWNRQLKVAGPVIALVNRLDDTTRTRLHDTAAVAASRYVTNDALELPGLALVLAGCRS